MSKDYSDSTNTDYIRQSQLSADSIGLPDSLLLQLISTHAAQASFFLSNFGFTAEHLENVIELFTADAATIVLWNNPNWYIYEANERDERVYRYFTNQDLALIIIASIRTGLTNKALVELFSLCQYCESKKGSPTTRNSICSSLSRWLPKMYISMTAVASGIVAANFLATINRPGLFLARNSAKYFDLHVMQSLRYPGDSKSLEIPSLVYIKQKKPYFSCSHSAYNLSTTLAMSAKGLLVFMVTAKPGTARDFTRAATHIIESEMLACNGELLSGPPITGVHEICTPICSGSRPRNSNCKQPRQSTLIVRQSAVWRRIIAKRFFGRISVKFRRMESKQTRALMDYKQVAAIAYALTGIDILLNPLSAADFVALLLERRQRLK